MITNVHIFTDEGDTIQATVDPEKKITVAYQNARHVPRTLIENYGHWVEVLDVSHNLLRNVDEIATAFKLRTLILDHNLITSNCLFPWMPQLQVLWLNNNLIYNLKDFIPPLSRACPNLKYLSLMGNSAAANVVTGGSEQEQEKYRRYVIGYFGHLRHLDDKPVTAIERLRCTERNVIVDNLMACYYDIKNTFKLSVKKTNCVV